MSLLLKNLKPAQILSVYRALGVIQGKRNAGHWLPDYKPGPVPKTEEERIAAAKKYNLLPEEYEPYEEGEGYGDYPKLPYESVDSKDPWYPWDNEELRKNFNEPVNVRMVNCFPEMDSTGPVDTPHWKGALYFIGICTSCFLIFKLFDQIKVLHIASEKQFPTPGVTHYTFEPDYDEAARRVKRIVCRELERGEEPEERDLPLSEFPCDK